MVAAHLTGVVLSHLHTVASFVLQEGGDSGNDPLSIWRQMGWIAKTVVVILFIMSGWSIGVMIDRCAWRREVSELAIHGLRRSSTWNAKLQERLRM